MLTLQRGSVHSARHAHDNSDGLLELSSSLRLLQFFAPGNWASNNAQDIDLSTEPALLRRARRPADTPRRGPGHPA
jgi:hypothetical protein